MRRTRTFVLFLSVLLLVALLSAASVVALCENEETPRISLSPLVASVIVGDTLNGSLRLLSNASGVVLGISPIGPVQGNISFNETSGLFLYTPNRSASGLRILFFAVTPGGCTASVVGEYVALHLPPINATPDGQEVSLKEGASLLFTAATSAAGKEWFLDDARIASGEAYRYAPGFNAAGNHTLLFVARAGRFLASNRSWSVQVFDANRPPVQYARLPNVLVPLDTEYDFNLSYYFLDPDRAPLRFVAVVEPSHGRQDANVSVVQQEDLMTLVARNEGDTFVRIVVTDAAGAQLIAEPFGFSATAQRRPVRDSFCGDEVCLGNETCASCAKDCGTCAAPTCTPHWDCSPWSVCAPSGYQFRNCTVTNGCDAQTQRPAESQSCAYNATCSDLLKNGNETGVDCGGACDACPSCSDGLQNQGESGVDCGGPCDACPSCGDDMQNQDESGVDCGGTQCAPCAFGDGCRSPLDCASRSCSDGVCLAPTCADRIVNGDEAGIDCGGICMPCPSCFDALKNQGESGVDCGGPCDACPSCFDNKKNQDEGRIDCGGVCRACTWRDDARAAWPTLRLVLVLFFFLAILYLLHSILVSRLIFLFRNGKGIHFFYEDAPTYALLRSWNSFARHVRWHREKELALAVRQTALELRLLRDAAPAALRVGLTGRLRALYASVAGVPLGFEFDQLVASVRASERPFAVKVILLKNTKLLALLELTTLYNDSGLALEEALKNLHDLEKAF